MLMLRRSMIIRQQ